MTDTAADQLAAAGLPPLPGPSGRAELLVMIAHRCVDWETWGGARAIRYWDAMGQRVRSACYAGPTLGAWWERLSRQMSLTPPRSAADREALATLLSEGADAAVLAVLRSQTELLLVRVRVAADTRRETRKTTRPAGRDESGQETIG